MGNNSYSYESQFQKNEKYKAKCLISSPNGLIVEGTVLTGEQWENVLVFEVGINSFDSMFELIK